MQTVEDALAAIPSRSDALSNIDKELSHVILFVQQVLGELHIGVPVEVPYGTEDGNYVLTYCKSGNRWQVMWGSERNDDDSNDVPLVGAPRHVRAEVFSTPTGTEQSLTPVERLFVAAAETLTAFATERSPQLENARRLAAVLEKAGFVDRVDR